MEVMLMMSNLLRWFLIFYAAGAVTLLGIRIWDVRFGGDTMFSTPPEWNLATMALYLAIPGIAMATGFFVRFLRD